VEKSSGTSYWYGLSGDVLAESTLSGGSMSEYVFFAGQRIAHHLSGGTTDYYFADHLGTSRVVTGSTGTILDQSDFYPFGGERILTSSSGNHYKFTGKERDTESGLDNFGARYNSSSVGRFMSPDPISVMKQRFTDPQQWNLYPYVRNSPLRFTDPTGMYLCKDSPKCDSTKDKAFEEARKQDLRSNDSAVKRAAKAYGDQNQDNGVTVGFGDPGNGHGGSTTHDLRVDPSDPSKFQAVETVTIRSSDSGEDLAADVAHEGNHVGDAQDFVATITPTGSADQSKNLTEYQTELKSFLLNQSVLAAGNEKRSYGDCGNDACILGAGITPAQAAANINRLLALPESKGGYNVTPTSQGPLLYPGLTEPR
jgi:RHS repeat-associated protein